MASHACSPSYGFILGLSTTSPPGSSPPYTVSSVNKRHVYIAQASRCRRLLQDRAFELHVNRRLLSPDLVALCVQLRVERDCGNIVCTARHLSGSDHRSKNTTAHGFRFHQHKAITARN
eukprot:1195797-Prorocentrum_minimum.AAC.14